MNIQDIRDQFNQAKGARAQVQDRIDSLSKALIQLGSRQTSIETAQALIQLVAKETQEKLRYHIEDIVNTALDTCFPGEYDFRIDFVIKRGRTEADLYLLKDGERTDPMDGAGGGVVDVVSFALRLSAWTLSKTDNVIVLDEPFKWLSVNLRPMAGEILKKLSEKLGIQIIMVTHDEEMINISNRVFRVSQRKARSIVEVK